MSTNIRNKISESNPYYISKHRHLELVHYCLQYDDLKQIYSELNLYPMITYDKLIKNRNLSDPTKQKAYTRLYFSILIDNIDESAKEACNDNMLEKYLLKGVTKGYSYQMLKTRYGLPYSRDIYYKAYRKFFYILDKKIINTFSGHR